MDQLDEMLAQSNTFYRTDKPYSSDGEDDEYEEWSNATDEEDNAAEFMNTSTFIPSVDLSNTQAQSGLVTARKNGANRNIEVD